MSLILRNVKGSPLTYTEMDDNLTYLEGLSGGTQSDLDGVLSNGNNSGTYSIEMGNGTVIKTSNGGGQINLDYDTNQVLITPDSGGFFQSALYLTNNYAALSNYNGNIYSSSSTNTELVSGGCSLLLNGATNVLNLTMGNNFGTKLKYVGFNEITTLCVTNNEIETNEVRISAQGDTTTPEIKVLRESIVFDANKYNVKNLPTSSSGLSTGDLFTQTATQLGGSGTTKVLCVF